MNISLFILSAKAKQNRPPFFTQSRPFRSPDSLG